MINLLTVYKSAYAQYNSVNNILLPILMVVGVTSSIVISNQAFAATYQNNRYGYSIWYPSNWIVNGSVWSSIIIIQPKSYSCNSTLLVVVAATTAPTSITYLLEHSKDIWTNQELTFEPVKNVTHITFLGIPAYKIVYGTNPLLPKQQMTKILTVKDGIEYSLDFDAHDPHLPVIQKMIDSFRTMSR